MTSHIGLAILSVVLTVLATPVVQDIYNSYMGKDGSLKSFVYEDQHASSYDPKTSLLMKELTGLKENLSAINEEIRSIRYNNLIGDDANMNNEAFEAARNTRQQINEQLTSLLSRIDLLTKVDFRTSGYIQEYMKDDLVNAMARIELVNDGNKPTNGAFATVSGAKIYRINSAAIRDSDDERINIGTRHQNQVVEVFVWSHSFSIQSS